jgi:hypothetical protein
MVKKQKAFMVAGLSALGIGIFTHILQKNVWRITTLGALQMLYVTFGVTIAIFIVGYFGMVSK